MLKPVFIRASVAIIGLIIATIVFSRPARPSTKG